MRNEQDNEQWRDMKLKNEQNCKQWRDMNLRNEQTCKKLVEIIKFLKIDKGDLSWDEVRKKLRGQLSYVTYLHIQRREKIPV